MTTVDSAVLLGTLQMMFVEGKWRQQWTEEFSDTYACNTVSMSPKWAEYCIAIWSTFIIQLRQTSVKLPSCFVEQMRWVVGWWFIVDGRKGLSNQTKVWFKIYCPALQKEAQFIIIALLSCHNWELHRTTHASITGMQSEENRSHEIRTPFFQQDVIQTKASRSLFKSDQPSPSNCN